MTGGKLDDAIVQGDGGVKESLLDVFVFECREFLSQFLAIAVKGEEFDDSANGEAEVADAGLTVHAGGVTGNAG